jgi:ATP-dependent helicase HrpB
MNKLPIYDVLDDIKSNLFNSNTLILEAPPGAGKSTVVPISFLDESWLEDKMIIMLEPRRVAARAVASRMASLLGEELGQRVGYSIKNDTLKSKDTKILVVTEAILVRMLQNDQSLENVAMVIFDEFHERSIHTDLSLALSLQVQELLRDDLKLLLMSATLNSSELLELLGDDIPVVTSDGKLYEVENIYLKPNIKQPDYKTINSVLVDTILKSLQNDTGDILVFLSGTKEIVTLQKLLNEKIKDDIDILPLYSNLSKKEQDLALNPSKKRKVILSTNIAQTSLTIEGVKVVVDTGLEKLSRYHHSNGMDHLELQFISNDSATQRAGRAGRTSSGKCYKLWSEAKILNSSTKPEVLRADLSSFILELALWGVKEFDEIKCLDIPKSKNIKETKLLLTELMMLDKSGGITSFGEEAISLGTHPRLAFMILKSYELGYAYEACILASLLEQKDIFKSAYSSSNIIDRFIHIFEHDIDSNFINRYVANEVIKSAKQYFKKVQKLKGEQKINSSFENHTISTLLLFAYPDRLAKLRAKNENRYKLSNGKGAIIDQGDSLFNEEFLVVSNLNAKEQNSYINLASPISLAHIKENFSYLLNVKESIKYNKTNKKFEVKEHLYFLELELESKAVSVSDKNFKELLLGLIKEEGLAFLPFDKKSSSLRDRVNFVNKHYGKSTLKSFEDDKLLADIDNWLDPYLQNIKSIKELESLDMYNILLGLLSWEEQQVLDKLAPLTIKVPSGSNIKIDYSDIDNPILAVKIQEVFGLNDTPKILDNSFALQLHLLSPASRAIAITYDLKSFWDNSYDEVAKELRGKYKKHYWPENPYEAVATNKTKKHMKSIF